MYVIKSVPPESGTSLSAHSTTINSVSDIALIDRNRDVRCKVRQLLGAPNLYAEHQGSSAPPLSAPRARTVVDSSADLDKPIARVRRNCRGHMFVHRLTGLLGYG